MLVAAVVVLVVPAVAGNVINPANVVNNVCESTGNATIEVPASIDGLVTRDGAEVDEVVCAEWDQYTYETPQSRGWGIDLSVADLVFLLPYAVLLGGLVRRYRREKPVRAELSTAGGTTLAMALLFPLTWLSQGALWAWTVLLAGGTLLPAVVLWWRHGRQGDEDFRRLLVVHAWTVVSAAAVMLMIIDSVYFWIA
jgi:hypothetical protein